MKRAFSRRFVRVALATLAVLVLAGWLLPSFLSFEGYRRFLRNGLEGMLGRKVTFDSLSFHLLPLPGFVIQNVRIDDDPEFGIEPFARIDHVDCDLRWTSLWRGRLILSGLDLENPTFNIVFADGKGWNVERLLRHQGYWSSAAASLRPVRPPGVLHVNVDDGRVNFKIDGVRKPFLVDDLEGQLIADPASHSVRFDLVGTPSRTDLMIPSPGPVAVSGVWSPGGNNPLPLTANLSVNGSLLYSWLPLVTGHNPEIYGLMNGAIRIQGTLERLKARGHFEISQVHRWELLPPVSPMPVSVRFEASADRPHHQLFIDRMSVNFAAAHLQLAGSIVRPEPPARMDLVVAVQHSPVQDLMEMASQLSGQQLAPDVAGDLDGLLTIRGTYGDERFSGFLGARHVTLKTPAGNFPVPQAGIRIVKNTALLMPVRIRLAPHFLLTAEGYWGPQVSALVRHPAALRGRLRRRRAKAGIASARHIYQVTLTSNSASLHEAAQLARRLGVAYVSRLDLRGRASGNVVLQGDGWPLSRPAITGRVEISDAQLVAPGLTEPLKFPQAQIDVAGDHIEANPVVLVIGRSRFSGRVEHEGARREPWLFQARCDRLTIEQAAQWFEALGHREPDSLLARIPGLASFTARLQAGRNIFGSLNAKGSLQSNTVSYRHVILSGFDSNIQISHRAVRITDARFGLADGTGEGSAVVDLGAVPARVDAQVGVSRVQLAVLAGHLPKQLRGVLGLVSAKGDFATRGLSRAQMATDLAGHAQLELHSVTFGSFNPVQAVATKMDWGRLMPVRRYRRLRFARFDLVIRHGKAAVSPAQWKIGAAAFKVGGSIEPGGNLNLTLIADLSHLTRRWTETIKEEDDPEAPLASFRVSGPYFDPRIKRISPASKESPK
jgi:AsmA family